MPFPLSLSFSFVFNEERGPIRGGILGVIVASEMEGF